MWKQLKLIQRLLKENILSLIGFELVYKVLLSAFGFPLLFGLLQFSMDINGYQYLDNTNIIAYLMEPMTLLLLIVLFLLMTIVTLIELHAIILCFHASYHYQHIHISTMLSYGVKEANRVWRRKNLILMLFVLLVVPLTNTAAVSGLISSIEIPEFILDFIMNQKTLACLFVLFMLGLYTISIRWSLSFHTYTLRDDSFQSARKDSVLLMKGNYRKTILYLISWQLLMFLVTFLASIVVCGICIGAIKLLLSDEKGYPIAVTGVYLILVGSFALLSYFSVPLAFVQISAMYYTYEEQKQIPCEPYKIKEKKKSFVLFRYIFSACIITAMVLNGISYLYMEQHDFLLIKELRNKPEITAHRGASFLAPENSIPAFEKAIEAQADWIELDVHQSKDGIVVVTHDADLKRIAGVDKNIYDVTYEELLNYDVGSWFSPEYANLRIVTLDEVLTKLKGKIKFNIELKPTGNEPDFEQHVIDIIRRHNMIEDCVVASLDAATLKKVKELDSDISTLYIMSVALGNITEIEFADHFSIEASFIKNSLLHSVHESNKQLFAWTVNQEENLTAMIKMGVDNIVTDDPAYAYQLIHEDMASDLLVEIISPLFPKK